MRLGPALIAGGSTALVSGVGLVAYGALRPGNDADPVSPARGNARTALGALATTIGVTAAFAGFKLLGRGVSPAAIHDIKLAAGALQPHHLPAAQLDANATQTPGRWVHATNRAAADDIVANGVRIDGISNDGAYGSGFYLSREPIAAYGSSVVPVSVASTNPLRIKERGFLNMKGFREDVAPLVAAFRSERPEAAARLAGRNDADSLLRAAIRHAGHDSILVERQGFRSEPWLVALDESTVKVVVR